MEVFVNSKFDAESVKGKDIPLGTIENPFTNLDLAYQKIEKQNSKIISCEGEVSLDSPEYENCEIKGNAVLTINKSVVLKNVKISTNIKSNIDPNFSNEYLIKCVGTVSITSKSITVTEVKHSASKIYQPLTYVLNEGDLNGDSDDVNVKVCREFTYVNNKGKMRVTPPNCESYGGNLFCSSENSTHNRIVQNSDTVKEIKINYLPNVGMIYNGKTDPQFTFFNGLKEMVFYSLKINMILPEGKNKKYLVYFKDTNAKNTVTAENSNILDAGSLAAFINCSIKGCAKMDISSDNKLIKLINSNIEGYSKIQKANMVTVSSNYVVSDYDATHFNVDGAKSTFNIIVPNMVQLRDGELYFKRIDSSGLPVTLKVEGLVDYRFPNGNIILSRQVTSIKIYKYENKFYVKYYN